MKKTGLITVMVVTTIFAIVAAIGAKTYVQTRQRADDLVDQYETRQYEMLTESGLYEIEPDIREYIADTQEEFDKLPKAEVERVLKDEFGLDDEQITIILYELKNGGVNYDN